MLEIAGSAVLLAALAVMLLHWRIRGGRFYYTPVSRVGLFVQGVCFAVFLAINVLQMAGRIGQDVYAATFTALFLLQVSYFSWRREHEHQRKSSVA